MKSKEVRIGLQFSKMQSLGDSYVLFNLLEDPMTNVNFPELSKRVSNVKVGIGSDGILIIGPSQRADFSIRVFNKDGTEANHCLSGIRCAAAYLYDTMYAESPNFTIETIDGDVSVKVEVGEKRKVKNVVVWDNLNRVWPKDEVRYVCYGELEEMTLLKSQDIPNQNE